MKIYDATSEPRSHQQYNRDLLPRALSIYTNKTNLRLQPSTSGHKIVDFIYAVCLSLAAAAGGGDSKKHSFMHPRFMVATKEFLTIYISYINNTSLSLNLITYLFRNPIWNSRWRISNSLLAVTFGVARC
jgi:hypothetical protein